jgi:hypothetical protein
MGATSGAHTAVGVVMTSPSSRTRDHRPAGSASAGIGMAAEGAAVAAPVSRAGLSGEDGQQVPALQLGLEADSDPPGRSITNLVEGAAQGVAGWPSVGHIDHS